MKVAIGIDIGGTKISMVLGSQKGKILSHLEIPTQTKKKTQACLNHLKTSLKALIKDAGVSKKNILGIGIALPGVVDSKKGVAPNSPNMPGWGGVPLAKILKKEFGLKVFMANDANAAAVAESIFGQAKKKEHAIYLTVSTGVGGGIISHGKLLEGSQFVGGEIGHMVIMPLGQKCGCGQKGCLEAYASGTAIGRYVEEQIRAGKGKGIDKLIGKKRKLGGKDLAVAVKKRHRVAIDAFRLGGYYLGLGIGNLLNVFNPEVVIIGGGVLKTAPKDHWQSMIKSVKEHSWPQAYKATKIVRSKLGDHVGNLGALALVFSNVNTSK